MSVPTREDRVLAVLSEVVGGPWGAHARPAGWWTPARVAICLTGATLLAGIALPGSGRTPAGIVGPAVLALLVTGVLVLVGRGRLRWRPAAWAAAPLLLLHWQSWGLVAAAGVALALAATVLAAGVLRWIGLVTGVGVLVLVAADRVTGGRPGLGSTWLLVEQVLGHRISAGWWLALATCILLAAGALSYRTWRRATDQKVDTVAAAGLVLLAPVLLVLPTSPPETSLALVPLAAMAVFRWSDLLAWQACEVVAWVVTEWFLAGHLAPGGGGVEKAYWLAILLRIGGTCWLVWAVVPGPGRQAMTVRSNDVAV